MKVIENIKYGEGNEQVINLFLPEYEEFDVLVFLHGGGLAEGDGKEEEFFAGLVDKGVAIVSGDYRKYPKAKYPEFIEDGAMVVAWAKENMSRYGKVNNLFVCGSSAGAYISQMLCFDQHYLAKHNVSNKDIKGYYFSAGQPTTHFNVITERGLDSRRVIIDDAAPIYHIREDLYLPPMHITVADNDMQNRLEQSTLLVSTLNHFGYDMNKIKFEVKENSNHCEYEKFKDENGNNLFAEDIYEFILWCKE